jgi:putative endonuclease
MSKIKKQKAFIKGEKAEKWAALYLWLKGYKILERRFKTPVREAGRIVKKPGLIVFVEVKARNTFEETAYSITPRQRKRITEAAKSYIMNNPSISEHDMRLDAVLILPSRLPIHLKDAWRLEE